jgi:hypothetical protein
MRLPARFHPARVMARMGSNGGMRSMIDRKHTARDTSTQRRGMLRPSLLIAGILLIAATAVGCGESDAEKAQTQVCDARADLKKQADELAALTPETATEDGVKANLNAMKKDLNEIKDAQGDLNEDRKQEVESATQDFTAEVQAVASELGTDLSASGAKAKLQASGQELASSYQKAFAQVDCS